MLPGNGPVVDHAAFETPRFVDDPFEQPGNGFRSEWSLGRYAPDVCQHLFFAIGLVDLQALLLLETADLTYAPRPLVQEPDEHFVDPIDVAPQIVKS
jgi:hypothetical protein